MLIAWLIMAAIVILSVLFVVRSVLQAANQPIKERPKSSFLAVREQEITNDLHAGRLTEEEANQLREDLVVESQYTEKQQFFLVKDVSVARWVFCDGY